MAIDKNGLIEKLNTIEGLTSDERSALLDLLRSHKKYGLVWEDKPEEVEERLRSELPVLIEDKGKEILSKNPYAPNHILIEGDNLEALTTLAYTHEGKVDVIYIDPPYNTGKKDFVYNDNYVDREDSYRHSKWLSFMSRRLALAKNLLSSNGVLFISIDDNEQANIRLLTDEIFGETNFLGQLILKTATDNNPSQINTEHEYMLCYAKVASNQTNWMRQSIAAKLIIHQYKSLCKDYTSIEDIQKNLRKWIRENKANLPQVAHYNNVDEKGVYSSSSNSSNPHPGGYMYDIIHPITHKPCPKPQNGWRWPKSTFDDYDKNGEIEWGKDHTTQPHVKKRIETSTEYLRTLIYEDNRGTTKALSEIFNGRKVFDNPKPQTVLSRIIDFASDTNATILDFFAGSGTTLHATMQLNAEDGGNRKCILITNNENGICENVTYERNKRVINGYTKPNGDEVEGLKDNNLRYYRTSFVGRSRTPKNMRELMSLATDMLCIKEDLYAEQKQFGELPTHPKVMRCFAKGDKSMLVIYYEEAIPEIVEQIEKLSPSEPIKVYVFSPSEDPWEEDFEFVSDKVELCALPAAIYNTYKRILPKKKDERVDIDVNAKEPEQPKGEATLFDLFEEGGEQ
jgi:adenine-specific DNA-methyltransferase